MDSPQKPTSIDLQYKRAQTANGVILERSPHSIAVTATDDDYWNSLPLIVRVLRDKPDPSKARQLAASGYPIIPGISDGGGEDAMLVLCNYLQNGWTWLPTLFQQMPQLPPLVNAPKYVPYDPLHPPPGSLIIDMRSLPQPNRALATIVEKEWYAALTPAKPPVPPPAVGLVGNRLCSPYDIGFQAAYPMATGVYSASAKMIQHFVEGQKYADPLKHATFAYHMLGTSEMDPAHRVGVWIGPLK